MLRKYLGQARMEQLILPTFTVSVDLVQGEAVVRDASDATIGVMESINLPPLSLPIIESGQALVDGGLLNNVPANVLVAKGCNFVIASTVTAKLEKDFEESVPGSPAVPGNNSSDHATDHGPGLQHELRWSATGRLCARARRTL
jgi:Predicted esterase of the alpha-beta hydrolase superfamily